MKETHCNVLARGGRLAAAAEEPKLVKRKRRTVHSPAHTHVTPPVLLQVSVSGVRPLARAFSGRE